MRLDLTRTPIATLLLRLRRPVLRDVLLPADRACRAYTEAIRRDRPPAIAPLPCSEDPLIMLVPSVLASSTSKDRESEKRLRGNPQRFSKVRNRSRASTRATSPARSTARSTATN